MKRKVRGLIIRHGVIETEERLMLRRKWLQVCVHSIIYYRFDNNVWTDKQWDKAAREVVILKNTYPGLINSMPFKEDLRKFDGTTGFELSCLQDPNMVEMARTILEFNERRGWDGKSNSGAKTNSRLSTREEGDDLGSDRKRTKRSKSKSKSKRLNRK